MKIVRLHYLVVLAVSASIAYACFVDKPPTPIISNAAVQYAVKGVSVGFDGTDSRDNDEDGASISAYFWSFDGERLQSAGGTPSHSYSSAGSRKVQLMVRDNEGTYSDSEDNASCWVIVCEVAGICNEWYETGTQYVVPGGSIDLYANSNPNNGLPYPDDIYYYPEGAPTWTVEGPSGSHCDMDPWTSEKCWGGGEDACTVSGFDTPGEYIVHAQAGESDEGASITVAVVSLEVASVGFVNDHVITDWDTGEPYDEDDDEAVWVSGGSNDPVCYTKNTAPTMFATFDVSPDLGEESINGVSVRAKVGATIIGSASNATMTGTTMEVSSIGGGAIIPNSDHVRTLTPTIVWEYSLDGYHWFPAGSSGAHTMYWVDSTPSASPLYDLGLDKACGYVDGDDSDIPAKINIGLGADATYAPFSAEHNEDLNLFDGTGQCCCFANVFNILLSSVQSSNGTTKYIFAGCSSSVLDTYIVPSISASPSRSFRIIASAHDQAPANPHYIYHAQVLFGGTYYNPAYGSTGLISFDEAAPAHGQFPAATLQMRDTPLGTITTHSIGWSCGH